MADALCGPSNALQNFQKHSSVDRTLQQDRLTNRHAPAQGFRSSPGASAGLLDPEFDAFQAGHIQPPQPDFHLLPRAQPQFPHFSQAPQAPDWASDFQRLNIASPHPPPQLQHHPPPQVSNATASWHQEFLRHQQPTLQQTPAQQNNAFGGPLGPGTSYMGSAYQSGIGFGAMNGAPLSEVASGKQRAQEAEPRFDDAAFEQAFAELDQIEAAKSGQEYQDTVERLEQREKERMEQLRAERPEEYAAYVKRQDEELERVLKSTPETDFKLARLRETSPVAYYTAKLSAAAHLQDGAQTALWINALDRAQREGTVTSNESEMRQCLSALNAISAANLPAAMQIRLESLVIAMNERLMSEHPFQSSLQRPSSDHPFHQAHEDAGNTSETTSQQPQAYQEPQPSQQEQQEQQHQPPNTDDDEMAETAGRLLERVADNTSEKFQNSQFLSLMRRLRDREVRVEGDKMVDVVPSPQAASAPATGPSTTTAVPDIDAAILTHAAGDFGMPVDSSSFEGEGDAEGMGLQGQGSIGLHRR